MATDGAPRHRVVIVGGGFGGLTAARALRGSGAAVTLVDRTNHHLFQPLLYQVATAALSPANIAAPLRAILGGERDLRVVMDEVTDVDLSAREVVTPGGRLPYDSLIVAAGARYDYFGHDEWERDAPGLKSIDDATEIRRRVLSAFEAAAATDDPDAQRAHLTFAVIGGGPTGVELAGALGEMIADILPREFPGVPPERARILLIEAGERPLSAYAGALSRRAARALERLGVAVRTGTLVTDVEPGAIVVRRPDGESERIPTRTVIWAAGVRAVDLARRIAEHAGLETGRGGRVPVTAELALASHPEVMVIGDMALVRDAHGKPLPGIAPVAIAEAKYAAARVRRRVAGERPPGPFRYRDRGTMATIGRGQAVAQIGWLRLWGFPGWVTWLTVHIMQLATYQSRALVLVQWAFYYLTHNRSARLIAGTTPPHLRRKD